MCLKLTQPMGTTCSRAARGSVVSSALPAPAPRGEPLAHGGEWLQRRGGGEWLQRRGGGCFAHASAFSRGGSRGKRKGRGERESSCLQGGGRGSRGSFSLRGARTPANGDQSAWRTEEAERGGAGGSGGAGGAHPARCAACGEEDVFLADGVPENGSRGHEIAQAVMQWLRRS